MTNVSRKGVWAIVLGSLAVATLIFFAWATSGFRNWDAASWFNYWGKGKPVVVRVAEPPVEQHSLALLSADLGLTYDSEDSEYTVNLQRYDSPTFEWVPDTPCFMGGKIGKWLRFGLKIKGNFHGDKFGFKYFYSDSLEVDDFYDSSVFDILSYDDYDEIYLTPEDFVIAFGKIPYKYVLLAAYNVGSGDYLDSRIEYFVSRFCPDEFEYTYNYETTTLEIPLIYEYVHDSDSECSYAITISDTDGNSITHASRTPLDCVTIEDNQYKICLASLPISLDLSKFYTVSVEPIYYINRISVDSVMVNFSEFHFAVSQLAQPMSFIFSNGLLKWDEVDGALGYAVFLGDSTSPYMVNNSEFDFGCLGYPAGEYIFRVRALGNLGQALATTNDGIELSAYNASSNIVQLVTLTYNINGDIVTKFVPHGSKLSAYTYEVTVSGKEFGGWYYDDGFSRKVEDTDVLSGDTVIYARLSDKKVVERKATWWDEYKWYVIGGLIGLVVLGIIAAAVVGIRKKKAA